MRNRSPDANPAPTSSCKHDPALVCQHLGTAWELMSIRPEAPLGSKIHTERADVNGRKQVWDRELLRFCCVFFSVTLLLQVRVCYIHPHRHIHT